MGRRGDLYSGGGKRKNGPLYMEALILAKVFKEKKGKEMAVGGGKKRETSQLSYPREISKDGMNPGL